MTGGAAVRAMRRAATGGTGRRVAGWVRARFALAEGDAVTVAELRCQVPGCPPVETVVLILGARRYRLKLFKPLADVTPDDLPPRWYLPALEDGGEADCGC